MLSVSCLGKDSLATRSRLSPLFGNRLKSCQARALQTWSQRRWAQGTQHPGRVRTGFRMKMSYRRKGAPCPASLLTEIRLRAGEGVPWPGCDPEGHWTVTSNEICEWKEVKMNLVRILKNIRGLKGIGEKIYFYIKLREKILKKKKDILLKKKIILTYLSFVLWFLFFFFSLTGMSNLSTLSSCLFVGPHDNGGGRPCFLPPI